MVENQIYYDIEFFRKIKVEIRSNPEKYREAGKWLDEYCSIENFWKRREDDLKNVKECEFPCPLEPGAVYGNIEDGTLMSREASEREYKREEFIYEKKIEYLELMIKLKKGYFRLQWLIHNWEEYPEIYTTEWLKTNLNIMGKVAEKSRLDDAYDYLTDDPARSLFIGLEKARIIILITWLLSDPDSENSGLNLTGFESWPWSERLHSTKKFLACYSRTLYSRIVDSKWMRYVRISWDEIQSAKKMETEKTKKNEKEIIIAKEPKKTVWKPPKGYIGSKEIVNDYKVPRSTLQGWAERDKAKVKKDFQTNEVYYIKKWFNKRFKNYRPRRKS